MKKAKRRQDSAARLCIGKEQGMTEEELRREAISAYYKAYREYKKLDNVRDHTYEDIYGKVLIEIHRYHGERKGERILRVSRKQDEEDELPVAVTAFRLAADILNHKIKERRGMLGQAPHSPG